jgi:hypothetical protein
MKPGERVEVLDNDEGRWIPGSIASMGPAKMVVETRERADGLVTTVVVPNDQVGRMIRPIGIGQEDFLLAFAVRVIANHCNLEAIDELWGFYPEIGLYDWQRITSEIMEITTAMDVSEEVFRRAYDTLMTRAELDSEGLKLEAEAH